jgi:hypothetical protein
MGLGVWKILQPGICHGYLAKPLVHVTHILKFFNFKKNISAGSLGVF